MKMNEYKLKAADNTEIHVYEWLPDNPANITGLFQIAHGMAEHAGRYSDFAQFLTKNGFAVYANDHRGHGKTAGSLSNIGFLAPEKGWDKLVSDFRQVSLHIRAKNSDKPLYVFGHSMGSFVIRKLIIDPGIELQGVILSGTGGNPGLLGKIGVLLTRVIMLFNSPKSPSPLMDTMSFGAFNKPFIPNRTKFDWLSRDNKQVDKYIADPFCGGIFSVGFFNDMLTGILFVSKQQNINKTPHDLHLLLLSGGKDPVGNNGTGVTEVYSMYEKSGLKQPTLKLFVDGRHEMLNEINKDEVYAYILDWLKMN